MLRMTQLIRFASKEDAREFYNGTYKDLLGGFEGLKEFRAAEVRGMPLGGTHADLIVDLYFEDEHAMDAAFATDHGRRISRELSGLGGKNVDIFECSPLD